MTIRFPRRFVAPTAAAAATALLLTGCSGGSGSSGGSNTVDMSTKAPTGVTLTMWHNSGDSKALLALYSAYEKESGNKINLVTLPTDTYPTAVQTKWATGDRPDILEYIPSPQDMRQLNLESNAVDLSKLAFVKAEGDLAKVDGTLNGKTYGVVLGPNSTFGEFYNKKVFAAAGLQVPTNYDELASDCTTLKAKGVTPISIGAGSEFPANMIAGFAYMADYNKDDAYGLSVASGKTKVSDPSGPIVAALTAVHKLVAAGCVNKDAGTATFTTSVNNVYAGKAALTILPSDFAAQFYALNSSAATVDATVGFGPISAKKGIASYSPGSYGTYFVPKTGDSTKERAAADFIQWASGKGYQKYVDDAQIVPTLTSAKAPAVTGMYASIRDMLTASTSVIAFNNSIPGFGNYGKIAVKVIVGSETPQQGANDFQTFVDQAIAAQK